MSVDRVRGQRLTRSERLEVRRRIGNGESFEDAAGSVRCSTKTVQRVLNSVGGVHVRDRDRSKLRLSLREREEISLGIRAGESLREIARRLNCSPSTISREVSVNGGLGIYRAVAADEAAYRRARRPKPAKLSTCHGLREEVEAMLDKRWSPQQISARLVIEFPDDPEMRVSHETIYRSLFVQSWGALTKELTACLRTGRTRRRPHGRKDPGGYIKDMVVISDRPAEIEDRAVPGHWEGDLIVGSGGHSAIVTLVERQTRYVMLARIGRDKTSNHVCAAIARRIQDLPNHLMRSLTWDRGKELASHTQFTIDTGVQVYFCDPHSPWQRGSNENTNGLLRQYFPKGTDLSRHSRGDLDAVALALNNRPRKTLRWRTPAEALNEHLRSIQQGGVATTP
ncbi:MAG: IS30 family transposase [Acidobacteria bacterium]|nr:IS30 family transposase [Acidobacteriota bacterium]